MNAAPVNSDRRINLELARDWAALGAEVRRRAAMMAVVDHALDLRREQGTGTDSPCPIRLCPEVAS